jgi:phage terminase small subunit
LPFLSILRGAFFVVLLQVGREWIYVKLTEKQRSFIEEYLVDLNATQAALRAGYSEKTAYSQGQRLLKNVEIQDIIQERMKERSKRTEVTSDRVVEELAKIAFSDLKDFVHWDENGVTILDSEHVDGSVLAEISETTNIQTFPNGGESERIQKKVKPHDKMKALEMLGKHLGMFKETVQHEGKLGVTIVDDIGEEDEG